MDKYTRQVKMSQEKINIASGMINLSTPTRKFVSVINCKRKNCATCPQLHKNSCVSSLIKRKYMKL